MFKFFRKAYVLEFDEKCITQADADVQAAALEEKPARHVVALPMGLIRLLGND